MSSDQRPDTQGVLAERGTTHGDYDAGANRIQDLKTTMRAGKNWGHLSAPMQESLDMFATKIGRILEGNPSEPDHWRDIVGYSTLVLNRLPKGQT